MRRKILAIVFGFVSVTACSEEGTSSNSPNGTTQSDTESYSDDSWSSDDSDSTGYDSNTVTSWEDSDSGPATWRFAVMGDSRGTPLPVNTVVLSKLVDSVLQQDVDLVIFTGDTVFGMALLAVQLPVWVNTMSPLWDAGISVYPVRGNHEATGLNINSLGAWQNTFVGERALPTNGPPGHAKATYSTVHKNAMFIALDQYVALHRIPQDWLDEQLAMAEVPHIFVFGHEPAFMADHADCLDDYPQNRDVFWSSLKDAGVRAYFCGHDHFYDHARVRDEDGDPDNDIHQFIVGTSGADLYAWSPPYNGENSDMTVENIVHVTKFGYMVGEVTGPDVVLTWINLSGDVEDSWSYSVY